MQNRDIQTLLADHIIAARPVYTGGIDGDIGPKTIAAMCAVESTYPRSYSADPTGWPYGRRLIAAAQVILTLKGYEPGAVDGYAGHNTENAFTAYQTKKITGRAFKLDRRPLAGIPRRRDTAAQLEFPKQSGMVEFYGEAANPDCTAGRAILPFPFVIAWNRSQAISHFSCHKKLGGIFTNVFAEAAKQYGRVEFERLELNLFGGCYQDRNMRGGKRKSMHAWGAAIDLNPEKNQLTWDEQRAQFAANEYVPFFNIITGHGGTPAGWAWGKDWMHSQWARL